MPNRDGTGPYGQGAMTGRGRGGCRGAAAAPDAGAGDEALQSVAERPLGRGMANRFGRRDHAGRGWCRRASFMQQ